MKQIGWFVWRTLEGSSQHRSYEFYPPNIVACFSDGSDYIGEDYVKYIVDQYKKSESILGIKIHDAGYIKAYVQE